jgi:hypothetical protein
MFQQQKQMSPVGPEQTTEKCKNRTPHFVSANRVEVNDAGVNAELDIETMAIECNGNMWTFDINFDGMNDSGSALWPAIKWGLVPNFNISNIYGNQADAHEDSLCDSYKNTTIRNLTNLTFWSRAFSYWTFYLIMLDGKVHHSEDNTTNCEPNSCPQFTNTMPIVDDSFLKTQIGMCTYDPQDQFTATAITTTTPTTTTKRLLLADLFGGG